MATLSSELILRLRDGVTGPARRVGRTMRGLDNQIDRTARNGGVMAMGLGRAAVALTAVGGAAIGAGVGIGSGIGKAMDMEDALASLAKVSTLSETQLAAMQDRARELSSTMPVAATEIVNLMAAASQFGIAAEDLEAFSLLATKASVAFDMDPSETAQRMSELRNGFKLTVAELGVLADALNTTADNAGTSESVLIDFLGRTASLANDLGVTGEEMAVIGATLSELGISAERSSTATNKVLTSLSDLSGNKDAAKILDSIGGKGYSARLQKKFFETPVDAIGDLAEITKDMAKEDKTGFLIELFGREHADEASALLGSFDRVEEGMDRLSGGKFLGSVDKTFELFAETTRQKLAVLRNNFSNVASAIGAEMLPGIVAFSEKLSDTLANLDERVTVFDTIRTAADGFFAGLIGDGDELQSAFDSAWNAVFGDPGKLEEDTAALARVFEGFKEIGADAQQAVSDIKAIAEAIDQLVGSIEAFMGIGDGGLADFILGWDHSDNPGLINKYLRGEPIITDPDTVIGRMDNERKAAIARGGAASADVVYGKGGGWQAYQDAIKGTGPNGRDYFAKNAQHLGTIELRPKVDTTEIEEAQTVTDTFSETFGTIGTTVVTPLVNMASINSANASAIDLLGNLRAIDTVSSPRPKARAGIDGARASGGPVWPGTFLVGEEGPELATFGGRGFVHNAADTRSIMDGVRSAASAPRPQARGPVSVTFGDIVVHGGANASVDDLALAFGRQVQNAFGSHFADEF